MQNLENRLRRLPGVLLGSCLALAAAAGAARGADGKSADREREGEPSASVTSIRNGNVRFSGKGPAYVTGVAFDARAGVAKVWVGIRRNDTGEWWSPGGWQDSPVPLFVPARVLGQGSAVEWVFDASSVIWSQATSYQVVARASSDTGVEGSPAESTALYVDAPAQLTASLAAAPGAVSVGQAFNVTLLVSNTGGTEALNIVPDDVVAEGAGGALRRATPHRSPVPSLGPGEFVTFSWSFTASGSGIVFFRAGCSGRDALSGASAEAVAARSNEVLVRSSAKLAVSVSPAPANVRQGSQVSVRMAVTNEGEADAQVESVTIRPEREDGFAVVSGPSVQTPFKLKGRESREVVWVVTAGGPGPLSITGSAAGFDEYSGARASSEPFRAGPIGVAGAAAGLQLSSEVNGSEVGGKVALTATVRDAAGTPVPGAGVSFAVLGGGGALVPASSVTDEQGRARTAFVLGKEPGVNTVEGRMGALLASISVESYLPGGAERILSRNFFDPSRGENVDGRVSVPAGGRVLVRVYSLEGKLVATLVDKAVPPGTARYRWNGRDQAGDVVPNGVYFVSVQAGSSAMSRRVMILKR